MFEDLVLDRRVKKMKVKSLRKDSLLLHEVRNVIAPSMLARPLVSCTRWFVVFFHCVVKSVVPVSKIKRIFCCGLRIVFGKVK